MTAVRVAGAENGDHGHAPPANSTKRASRVQAYYIVFERKRAGSPGP
jgi:hypothetical protein